MLTRHSVPEASAGPVSATRWLAVRDGFASFVVPADHIQNALGDVSVLAVEGNFGPSFHRAQLVLTLSGNAWTAMIGPLAPGSYHYRVVGDGTRAIKDPTNSTSVAAEPTWSRFFVPGLSPRLLTDVPDGDGLTLETAGGAGPTPWLTSDADGNTLATFETSTDFAEAQYVTLWGNWAPGGSWLRIPLVRSGDRWRATLGPLQPGFYYYQYFVDHVARKDTSNPTVVASEPTWSTFLVCGQSAKLLADVPNGSGGRVETLTYDSAVARQLRKAYVWTPPGYDPQRTDPYPVLYLQHGSGQSYTDWIELGRAKQILDNQFLAGSLVPMVVVMGNGNVSDFTTELLENLVPAARASYNIASDPARQAIAGLSMGGFQTYDVLKARPGAFAYAGTFSAGLFSADGIDAAAINQGTTLLQVYCGDQTDFLYPAVQSALATFDDLGVRHEFDGPTPGPHGWDTWQRNFIDFAPRLFRDGAEG